MDPRQAALKKMMADEYDPAKYQAGGTGDPEYDQSPLRPTALREGLDYDSGQDDFTPQATAASPDGMLQPGKARLIDTLAQPSPEEALAGGNEQENVDNASFGYGDGTTLNMAPPQNIHRVDMDTTYSPMPGYAPPLAEAPMPMDPKRPWLSERPSSLQQDDGSDPDDGLLAMLGIK